ncbi:MAG: hypothetical protein WEG36_12370 [Gemmatimonadota bacterium]
MSSGTDPIAAYDALLRARHEKRAEAGELEGRLDQVTTEITAARSEDRTTEAARAVLDGTPVANIAAFEEERTDLRRQIKVLHRVDGLYQERIDAAKGARDAKIMDAAEPRVRKAVQEVAEALQALSGPVGRFVAEMEAFRDQDVAHTGRFPGLNVRGFLGKEPDSRINRLLDEIESDYGVRVKRPERDEELKARKAALEKIAARDRLHGESLAAGPDGIFRWVRGRKVSLGTPV